MQSLPGFQAGPPASGSAPWPPRPQAEHVPGLACAPTDWSSPGPALPSGRPPGLPAPAHSPPQTSPQTRWEPALVCGLFLLASPLLPFPPSQPPPPVQTLGSSHTLRPLPRASSAPGTRRFSKVKSCTEPGAGEQAWPTADCAQGGEEGQPRPPPLLDGSPHTAEHSATRGSEPAKPPLTEKGRWAWGMSPGDSRRGPLSAPALCCPRTEGTLLSDLLPVVEASHAPGPSEVSSNHLSTSGKQGFPHLAAQEGEVWTGFLWLKRRDCLVPFPCGSRHAFRDGHASSSLCLRLISRDL